MKVISFVHMHYPTQRDANGSLLAVLTDGGLGANGGDLSAYAGIVNLDVDSFDEYPEYATARETAANWVAHSGHKLTLDKARAYFPDLSESDYRA